jgi:predicted metal-binding protein
MKIKNDEDRSNKDVFEDGGKIIKNYKKAIFFRFKVEKKMDDPIMLQLVDM